MLCRLPFRPPKHGGFEPLRRYDPNLGQMPAKRVDQLRAVSATSISRSFVMYERRLVLQRAHSDKRIEGLSRFDFQIWRQRPHHSSACAP